MNTCPDCHAGKHANCLGDAWDDEADQPTTCACWARDHEEPHDPSSS